MHLEMCYISNDTKIVVFSSKLTETLGDTLLYRAYGRSIERGRILGGWRGGGERSLQTATLS